MVEKKAKEKAERKRQRKLERRQQQQQMPPPIREESNEQNNNNSNQQKPRNFEATGQHGNLQSQRRKNNLDDSDEFDDADIDDLLA